jgi:hypothetical protein
MRICICVSRNFQCIVKIDFLFISFFLFVNPSVVWCEIDLSLNQMEKKGKKEKTSNCNYDNEDLRKDVCLHFITFFFSFFKTKTLTWIEQNAVKKKKHLLQEKGK